MTNKKQDNYAAVVVVLAIVSVFTWPALDFFLRTVLVTSMISLGIMASITRK